MPLPYIWGRKQLISNGGLKSAQQRPGVIKFKFPVRTLYAADIAPLAQYPPALWPDGRPPANPYSARVFRQMTRAQFYQQELLRRMGRSIIHHWRQYYAGPIGWFRILIDRFSSTKRIRLQLLPK